VHLPDEVAEHRLRDLEVRDHPVLHRPNGLDVTRCATQHAFRLIAYSQYAAVITWTGVMADRHDRGFVQDDSFVAHVHQCVSRAKIYGQVA
jgi:hypothetical protein